MTKKRANFLCMVLIFSIFHVSCMWDPYSNERPFDYENAKWVCEDPYIYFNVDKTEEYYYPHGEIQFNDSTYPCKFYFIHQTNELQVVVYKTDNFLTENIIGEIDGECDFSSNALVFHIDKKRDTIFDGKYDTMKFYKN